MTRDELYGGINGPRGSDAEKALVVQLRALAEHIEAGKSPYLFAASVDKDEPFTTWLIELSSPWGG